MRMTASWSGSNDPTSPSRGCISIGPPTRRSHRHLRVGVDLFNPNIGSEIRSCLGELRRYSGRWVYDGYSTTVAEDVGDRRFLGDLYRAVQRQQGHRRAEANT